MYVVSFTDFIPEPRFDGVSWHHVTVEESADNDGPWTLIDTIGVGVDVDPAHPAARSFTTAKATLQSGWYRITFLSQTGADSSQVAPVHYEASADASYLPTVQQVARKIMSRTRDQYGKLQETFNGTTIPSDTVVANIANDVITEVADVIGDTIPEPLWDDAQNVVALRTAMEVETNFYSEQVANNRSAYPLLEQQYKDALAALSAAVAAYDDSGEVVSSEPGRKTSYSFPDAVPWLTRKL